MNTNENITASIHQKLLNKARETKRPFNELLQYYAMEKFLLRMSRSRFAEDFVLKGALLLRSFGMTELRVTRDIDVLKFGEPDISAVEMMVAECCIEEVEEDGLAFDPESVASEEIREQQAYQGIRINVQGRLANARINLQIDMGFGDIVTPEPHWIEYPAILDGEQPRIKAYTLESAIAEKYQAMVDMGLINSRMKDYYDIFYLAGNRSFEGVKLQNAIRDTFQRRKTSLPREIPLCLTHTFYEDEQKLYQWAAFEKKLPNKIGHLNLEKTVRRLGRFLWPPTEKLEKNDPFVMHWDPTEGWK